MSSKGKKRKGPKAKSDPPVKKRQLVGEPSIVVEMVSDASTLPYRPDLSGDVDEDVGDLTFRSLGDFSLADLETGGGVVSDDALSSLSDEENPFNQDAPLRNDMDIVRDRWDGDEVDSLMDAININRDAIKYHFDGPGGGKDIKRQGWKDVARHVNSAQDTHRTVRQCRNKVDDYTGRVKQKFDRLRFEVNQTGKGKIRDVLKIKDTEAKALDYLREEAVKGIPGIEPLDIGGVESKPSKQNLALLWKAERDTKPDYASIKMERQGVPKNYKDKNKRRVEREKKAKNKIDHEIKMKAERKKERADAKLAKKYLKEELKLKKKESEERKLQVEKRKREKAKRKENSDKKEKKARKKAKKERKAARLQRRQEKKRLIEKKKATNKSQVKEKKAEKEVLHKKKVLKIKKK